MNLTRFKDLGVPDRISRPEDGAVGGAHGTAGDPAKAGSEPKQRKAFGLVQAN